jgi:phage tail sheath protein FI
MAFFHGVRTRQVPTALVASARVNASLVIAFGTAPIHRLEPDAQEKALPGSMHLCFSNADAANSLGINGANDDFGKWGLSEVAFSQFSLFGVAPVIFANIFDPDIHYGLEPSEELEFTGVEYKATLKNRDLIGDIILTNTTTPTQIIVYEKDLDFTIDNVSGVISVIAGSPLEAAIKDSQNPQTVVAAYKYAAPEKVEAKDCYGGFDKNTGKSTGLELIEAAFPRFGMAPGIILCPNFSADLEVAGIMAAKTQNINGVFNCVAFADIPSEGENAVTDVAEVPEYKNNNSLVSENMYLCYPKVRFGNRTMNMSTQAAGVMAGVDNANGNIPFASPSNKNLQCQAAIIDGKEEWLTLTQANFLNANGITTALNFVGGWKLWGNRTAAYPGNTDPKDVFISNRRMLAWYGNQLVLTWFQRVDFPISRRLIQTILNSEAININSLTAAGALTGGRIEFNDTDNPITDLMDGKIVFHVFLGLAAPAESIEFLLEYDPEYLQTLFS